MKNIILTFCFVFVVTFLMGQTSKYVSDINHSLPSSVALEPLRFLAADELMGRGVTRPEINIAARYISEEFRAMGLKQAPSTTDYFQTFELKMKKPATEGSFTVNGNTFEMPKTMIEFYGEDVMVTAPVVYANHGMENNLNNIDVKGKIVITEAGEKDSNSFMEGYYMMEAKRKLLQQKGALAIVERFKEGSIPWTALQNHLNTERPIKENDEATIPVFIVNDESGSLRNITEKTEGTLSSEGTQIRSVSIKNIMGYVEGTDAKLKDQYIVLTAHYDHLGVAGKSKLEEGKQDSIYNGARDNAIGTTAVMDAAKYFSQHPPKRSVLFIAYTAEEVGEIGSKYFSKHPLIPLKQIVYNLNIDNASYNDTTIVTVVGLGRTSADDDIKEACAAYGLKAMPDPAPEENLFDRSDNVNLAVHGIPAPTFSLGIKKFDDEINKRYHQLSDEVGNFDLNYGLKYIRSFVLASQLIADDPNQPKWKSGDKYEEAWKELYK